MWIFYDLALGYTWNILASDRGFRRIAASADSRKPRRDLGMKEPGLLDPGSSYLFSSLGSRYLNCPGGHGLVHSTVLAVPPPPPLPLLLEENLSFFP
jgi:hypothetical protein